MAGRNNYRYTPSAKESARPRQSAPRTAPARYAAERQPSGQRSSAGRTGGLSLETLLLAAIFVILPLVLVIGLFAGPVMWVFIILALIVIAVMWVLSVFAPRGRVLVSLVLGALCVIALLTRINFSDRQTTYRSYGAVSAATDTPSAGLSTTANNNPAYVALGGNYPTAAVTEATPTTGPAQSGTQVVDTGTATLSAAQEVLDAYLTYWQQQRYEDMIQYTLPSWRAALESPQTQLFFNHSAWDLKNWTVTPDTYSANSDSVTFTVIADLERRVTGIAAPQQFSAILFNTGGTWYVDPDSLRTGIAITVTEAPSLANANAPQEPTPIPEPTTNPTLKLYYNTKGGSFYHLLQKCESINSKYYDSMAAFTYSQLNDEPYSKLKPCSVCGAPKRPNR